MACRIPVPYGHSVFPVPHAYLGIWIAETLPDSYFIEFKELHFVPSECVGFHGCQAVTWTQFLRGEMPEVDSKLLEILVCPVSKASLSYRKDRRELWCKVSRLAYPIRDDIPIMLESEARTLSQEELDEL